MSFIQIVEFTTTRPDEVKAVVEEYRASTEGTRATGRGTMCADRDQANRYVTIVEFESYEAAMENSELPETSAMAARIAELCDGPPTFRNLDVVERIEE